MKLILEKIGRHKKIVIALVIVIAVALTASALVGNAKEKQKALMAEMTKLETEQIEKRTLVESISATGTVTSAGSKSVIANVTGVDVLEVNVEVGDTVAEGDVLCTLDTEELEIDLADAKTALNVAQEKAAIQESEAARSLAVAEQNRNMQLEQTDADVAKAWNDYLRAVTDLEEAENDYNEAQATTISKNAEYEYSKQKLEEAEEDLNGTASGAAQSDQYATSFSVEVKALKEYLTQQRLTALPGALDYLYISNAQLQTYSAGTIVDTTQVTDADKIAAIDNYLGTLKGYQTAYQKASAETAAYQQVSTEYQQLQSEVSAWQSKYEQAKQAEESLENAYESQIKQVESYLQNYNDIVRKKEQTVVSQDDSVDSKKSSLTTTQIGNSTTGSSEKKQIRQYEDQIEACTVTAPMKGVITEVNVEAGDSYKGTAIVTIEDTSAYEVSVEISEYDINKVEIGQTVVIKTNATGDEELQGTVKEIAPRATTGSSDITYAVTISVDTPCDALKMDMTAKISIILESKENVLTVPYDAVQEDEAGNYYIEVVSEDASGEPEMSGQTDQAAQPEGVQPEGTQPEGAQPEAAQPENGGMPQGAAMPDAQQTRKISITKGIESDYYIEVISEEVQEGMEVVIPAKENSGGFDIQMMMQQQGPMGGF